jgi:hypothetical protein
MTKFYQNGDSFIPGDHTRARDTLIAAGIYDRLGNFGPYHSRMTASDRGRIIEEFVLGDYSYTIVRGEITVLGGSRQTEDVAYYQPAKKQTVAGSI